MALNSHSCDKKTTKRVLFCLFLAMLVSSTPYALAAPAQKQKTAKEADAQPGQVKDMSTWQNPVITIYDEYVIVSWLKTSKISKVSKRQSKTLQGSQVADLLLSLPSTAWPCGRVMAVTSCGLGSGSKQFQLKRAKTLQQIERAANSLQIKISCWPSA